MMADVQSFTVSSHMAQSSVQSNARPSHSSSSDAPTASHRYQAAAGSGESTWWGEVLHEQEPLAILMRTSEGVKALQAYPWTATQRPSAVSFFSLTVTVPREGSS